MSESDKLFWVWVAPCATATPPCALCVHAALGRHHPGTINCFITVLFRPLSKFWDIAKETLGLDPDVVLGQ